jgi:hypothetical protein
MTARHDFIPGWRVHADLISRKTRKLAALFDVLQPRVQHLFDSAEFGSPEIAHIVEAFIYGIKPSINRVELRIDQDDENDKERRIEKHRDADCEIKLLVRHQDRVRSGWFYSLTRHG